MSSDSPTDPDDLLAETLERFRDFYAAYTTAPARPRARPAFVEQFAAVLRNGPCATNLFADYTDARYYLDRAVPDDGLRQADRFSASQDNLPGVGQCLTATNLAELPLGSHLLPAGTLVQVFTLYPREGAKQYVFNHPPPSEVAVKITGAAGGGKYTGRILGGQSTAAASGNLAMPEGMTLPPADNALIINPAEDGLATHLLQPNTFHAGRLAGASNGLTVVQLDCLPLGVTASPTVLGSTSEGSESPDSATWLRSTSNAPLDLFVVSRTVYNEAGDKTLYQFVRKLSFDACGLLIAVTAETRVTIDVTEPC